VLRASLHSAGFGGLPAAPLGSSPAAASLGSPAANAAAQATIAELLATQQEMAARIEVPG